jgi:diguanylate cyclase (GGDEF)-like protein
MTAPLMIKDKLVGTIGVVNENPESRFTESDKEILLMFARQAAIAIQNARLLEEAQSQALTDSLTTLFNRRAFDLALEREVSRAKRYGYPLSLAILDIDDFKIYNDTYGHPAGDEQLKRLASLLLSNVRESDLVARYGGEEFAIICPQCEKQDAVTMLERIRHTAEATSPSPPEDRKPIPGYTLSIGVATLPDDTQTGKGLLMAADTAELKAKHTGKNRVVCSNGG